MLIQRVWTTKFYFMPMSYDTGVYLNSCDQKVLNNLWIFPKKKFLGEEFLSCRKVLSHALFGIEKN